MTDTHAARTAAGESGPASPRIKGLGLGALTALVVGSMIGGGIFALPSQMASVAAPIPLLIGWLITGIGMFTLARVFQTLANRKPDVDGGVYGYARKGFGNYIGYTSAWGYWISAWVGNVGFLVLLFSAMGTFFPLFAGGNTIAAVVGASLLMWFTTLLCIRGVQEAAVVNIIVTIAKIVPLLVFLVVAAVGFQAGLFSADLWGQIIEIEGKGLGGVFDQVKGMMLVTVWVFIGIEGASIFSARARNRRDVGRATLIGFIGVLALLILLNVLSYGLLAQAEIAGLRDPSLAGLMESQLGRPGSALISIGLVVSLLGANLSWTMLAAEVLRLPAQQGILPHSLGRENGNQAPTRALVLTGICVQVMLIWTLFNSDAYTKMILLASALILLPYLWSALFQVKLVVTGETYAEDPRARRSDALFGILATVYAIWLVYAGGIGYVLVAGLFYLLGTGAYVWARHKAGERAFSRGEYVILGLIIVTAIAGATGLAMGWITL